jgi:hypothetical protein
MVLADELNRKSSNCNVSCEIHAINQDPIAKRGNAVLKYDVM